ncbi:MAG: J domain-containing protein [Akkermansia sp.]
MRADYYELLDVAPTVSPAELKAAYHRQARRFHPDLNPGNAAAEERFKLVAEAYRVLSDEEQRYHYDGWLERHRRLSCAPELESMPHRVRVSSRRGAARRGHAGGEGAAARRRIRPFLLRTQRSPAGWVMVAVYAMGAFLVLPVLIRSLGAAARPPRTAFVPKGPTPTAEQVRERLAAMNAELLAQARAGDAVAQMRYGLLLYRGAGIAENRQEARAWWRRAAAQGNDAAQYYLAHCPAEEPAAEPAEPPVSAPEGAADGAEP